MSLHHAAIKYLIEDKITSSYSCNNCKKSFRESDQLIYHTRYVCGKDLRRFQCPYCEHKSKWKCRLKTHIALKHKQLFIATDFK
uniref:C2H2-type domain-containing protein n=1 Tax=Rhodnius prolixus TaxID=13249 RepID=T1HQ29_RHOPR